MYSFEVIKSEMDHYVAHGTRYELTVHTVQVCKDGEPLKTIKVNDESDDCMVSMEGLNHDDDGELIEAAERWVDDNWDALRSKALHTHS